MSELPNWWVKEYGNKPYAIMDCLEGMRKIPDNSIDLVVTSPPYNVGIDYGECYNDNMEYSDYLFWLKRILWEVYRIMKPDGRIALNHYLCYGNAEFRASPISDINQICLNLGFRHHAIVVWPDRTLTKRTAWGSWKSASSPYINTPYEGILIMYKTVWKKEHIGIDDITKEVFMELCGGVWNIPTEKKSDHPAPFPVELPQKIIQLLSFVDNIVLDPFLGSGTTLLACRKTGRIGLGFEINKDYEDIIRKRALLDIKPLEGWFSKLEIQSNEQTAKGNT